MPTYGKTLPHAQVAELCQVIRSPDATPAQRREAAEAVVRGSMGVVWTVLERAGRKGDDELIQEGRLGLWYAAQRFDPSRARWSTFAFRVVRQYIGKARSRRPPLPTCALPKDAGRLIPEREQGQRAALPVEALQGLDEDHRRLLHHLYSGEKRRTLAEAAADLGVTQHRAEKLHQQALEALRQVAAGREAA